jgi:hypothetical protein
MSDDQALGIRTGLLVATILTVIWFGLYFVLR